MSNPFGARPSSGGDGALASAAGNPFAKRPTGKGKEKGKGKSNRLTLFRGELTLVGADGMPVVNTPGGSGDGGDQGDQGDQGGAAVGEKPGNPFGAKEVPPVCCAPHFLDDVDQSMLNAEAALTHTHDNNPVKIHSLPPTTTPTATAAADNPFHVPKAQSEASGNAASQGDDLDGVSGGIAVGLDDTSLAKNQRLLAQMEAKSDAHVAGVRLNMYI